MHTCMQEACCLYTCIISVDNLRCFMPVTVRLTKDEEDQLRRKCIEVNKRLIAAEKKPIRESELVHYILNNAIKAIKINKDGTMFIDETNT